MSAASLGTVRHAIERGDIAPVYYLTGEEEILKDELVKSIVSAAVDAQSRDFDLDIRMAGDLNAESLHALVETPPMLADRRVAVVRGPELWRRNSKVWQTLVEYLDRPSSGTILVLVGGSGHQPDKTIAQRALHVSADTPSPDQARAWVTERAANMELALSPEAASHLLSTVDGNLSHAAMELEKLAAALPNNGTVDVADIERFVGVRHGETLSDWLDAVSQRKMRRAMELLDIVMAQPGTSAVKMLNALGTSFVATRFTQALMRKQRKSARQLRDAVWRFLKSARIRSTPAEVDRWIAAAGRWRADELDAVVGLIHHADDKLKSTTIGDSRATLANMLLRIPTGEAQ